MTTGKELDIAGLGVCTLDVLMRVDAFSGEGETVQRAEASVMQGGGPVATALAAASRLGARTAMIDRVGTDWRGDFILRELAEFGVETAAIQREAAATSSLASVWVRKADGARCIAYAPGTARELAAADLPEAVIRRARILHVNGRHAEALPRALEIAREASTRISLDGGAGRFQETHRAWLPAIDCAIIARDYAACWTGENDPQQAAAKINLPLLVITDGLAGSWVFPQAAPAFHQPAFQLARAVDTTGCGDVYHGAFLAGLAREVPLRECARLASAAAALNAQALGGRGRLATRAEIEAAF